MKKENVQFDAICKEEFTSRVNHNTNTFFRNWWCLNYSSLNTFEIPYWKMPSSYLDLLYKNISNDLIASIPVGALATIKQIGHDAVLLKNGIYEEIELKLSSVSSKFVNLGPRGGWKYGKSSWSPSNFSASFSIYGKTSEEKKKSIKTKNRLTFFCIFDADPLEELKEDNFYGFIDCFVLSGDVVKNELSENKTVDTQRISLSVFKEKGKKLLNPKIPLYGLDRWIDNVKYLVKNRR